MNAGGGEKEQGGREGRGDCCCLIERKSGEERGEKGPVYMVRCDVS